jgi:hypothetical protein
VWPRRGGGGDDSDDDYDWEDKGESLPDDLVHILKKVTENDLKLDVRKLLEDIPYWKSLKERAEPNKNSDKEDKVLASAQNRVLSLCRIFPILHNVIMQQDDGAVQQLSQQYWALLVLFEQWLMMKRKDHALPGCIPEANPLITSEDIKNYNEKSKNPNGGMCLTTTVSQKRMFHFPTPTAYKGFKYKSYN